MGGAVCFNNASCNDGSLRRWTDLKVLLTEFMGMSTPMWDFLSSGSPIAVAAYAAAGTGYVPDGVTSHPLNGRRGIFIPTCTADLHVGNIDIDYNGKMVYHHG